MPYIYANSLHTIFLPCSIAANLMGLTLYKELSTRFNNGCRNSSLDNYFIHSGSSADSSILSSLEQQHIPPAYLLGVPPRAIPLTLTIATLIAESGGEYVIDIGSGKGYLSRLLSNHYQCKVFCVDEIGDRLKSSLKLDRLINSHNNIEDAYPHLNANIGSNNMTFQTHGNLAIMARRLESMADFNDIMANSISWFERFSKLHKITILGIKVCGDIFYQMAKFLANWIRANSFVSIEINMVVVPCCVEKSILYPHSKRCQMCMNKDGSSASEMKLHHLNVLTDMLFYAEEMGFKTDISEANRWPLFTLKFAGPEEE